MNRRPIIIDTDPGIDDAAAIIAALNNNDKLDIKLFTSVFGNVDLEKTTKNTLKILEFMNSNVPVAKGAPRSIFFDPKMNASDVHGESGLGGYEVPEPTRKIMEKNAVEAMKEVLEKSIDKVTIVILGVSTNLALLLIQYPYLKEKIEEVVIMGGSLSLGNTNTAAEFNVYKDPHATKIVFDSGLKITVFGLDVTRKCRIRSKSLDKLKTFNKVSNMCYSIFKYYRGEGFEQGLIMHDSTTIAYLLNPEMFKFEKKYIDVATEGAAIGSFVADYYTVRNGDKNPNVNYAVDVNEEEFERWLVGNICK